MENYEDKFKITLNISKKKFKLLWGLLTALPFLVISGAFGGFQFPKWYQELSEEFQKGILIGSIYLILYALVSYVFLIYFLIQYYKEEDRAYYIFWTIIVVVLCIVRINIGFLPCIL